MVTGIILTGISITRALGGLLFLIFLLTYLVTVLGNTLIITLILVDYRLQSPMYFFLSNLSFSEILTTTCAVPTILAGFLLGKKSISIGGCFAQMYCYFLSGCSEFLLFAIMSYGCYVAICSPLHAPLLHLACADIRVIERLDFLSSLVLLISSLSLTVVPYVYILSTILKIPSGQGQCKAFATCASHFTVVSMGYRISIFVYACPSQKSSLHLNKTRFVLSSVITPLLNPFIFSLWNESMKDALKDTLPKGQNCLKGIRST
ncbi:PREDICTED: olfactory receptor 6M1-like [Ceratotherium simum simum]|uniref:Olfactory receptor 6M1-like n=1 Tax=Ceratotherium simum simum TaxID=73337 RepID=A0ABM0HAP0_CERSS|nr:PREDICTED: olfactory receptor 6M1-like [Ceratotherium simum simum]